MAKTQTSLKKHRTTKHSQRQHPKHFLKVYWPYIPIIVLVVASFLFGSSHPYSLRENQTATMAYATEISNSALLSSTNAQRAAQGVGALTLNGTLSASAQAKANDMVARDYWAHNTPDGQEPWVFFDAAGYVYQKAGENLAYGFSTSSATVIGWMNSPSHRANMLDVGYSEVGFGFANSNNFVGTGEETIVVAHYGTPVAPDPAPVSQETTPPTPAPAVTPQSLPASRETEPVVEQEVVTPAETPPAAEEQTVQESLVNDRYNQPVTSDSPVPEDKPSTQITRVQSLTLGKAPWSALALSSIVLGVLIVWIIKHAVLVKRFVLRGEYFVAHHPVLDLAVIILAALSVYLTQTSGVVL